MRGSQKQSDEQPPTPLLLSGWLQIGPRYETVCVTVVTAVDVDVTVVVLVAVMEKVVVTVAVAETVDVAVAVLADPGQYVDKFAKEGLTRSQSPLR